MPSPPLRRLLLSCSTARPSAAAYARLEPALRALSPADQAELLSEAEDEGIGPLVALHLGGMPDLPVELKRGLAALSARHLLAHQARTEALGEALRALNADGIDHLLLKGAALAHLVYPRPELRPMRDVDLLVREADLERAESALARAGLSERREARPDRHEVVTRLRTIRGFQIGVDLHRRLGIPSLPSYAPAPRQHLDELWPDSQPLELDGTPTRAPSNEDLLRHGFRHGFGLQLDEDRVRFITIADMLTALEHWVDVLDLSRLRELDGEIVAALGMFHHVVPLSSELLRKLDYRPGRAPLDIGQQYWGWPRSSAGERSSLMSYLGCTIFPSEWWLRLRHGRGYGPLAPLRSWLAHLTELAHLAWRAAREQPRIER